MLLPKIVCLILFFPLNLIISFKKSVKTYILNIYHISRNYLTSLYNKNNFRIAV
uniref:Uncharacterized protein n=1 Tax=Lepeophtheirus salmonis TaxID=72036 RepID=A0A0K2VEA8_LEPSM